MENLQEPSLLYSIWMKMNPVVERLFLIGAVLMVIELTLGVIAISQMFFFPPIVWIQLRECSGSRQKKASQESSAHLQSARSYVYRRRRSATCQGSICVWTRWF
jgi:hypothetical protein